MLQSEYKPGKELFMKLIFATGLLISILGILAMAASVLKLDAAPGERNTIALIGGLIFLYGFSIQATSMYFLLKGDARMGKLSCLLLCASAFIPPIYYVSLPLGIVGLMMLHEKPVLSLSKT